ncbi:hypothetical protein TH9_12255 [Thalassospira xiamenensis]|uniref:hypothetical protein n=1 Tax=Thalassospira xiamenensis TaxID=220697 RepID=UPI000DED545F|nr:hypothetical protein [Thalassospira xiamenensis]RCK32497.1 hypothetical protein TH9_12255 [Thalassospira xiamenensis]
MGKCDVMDAWSALQWAVRDQKADWAFAANDDWRMLAPGGSVTAAMMRIGELNTRVDGGGRVQGSELDPDAERIWMAVLMLMAEWDAGELHHDIGAGLSIHMQRSMMRLSRMARINPVRDAVSYARVGNMPGWYRSRDGWPRRDVEESRLHYVLVWDVLHLLYTRLAASTSMGIVIEMPTIPRLPWQGRKKDIDDCA